MGIWDDLILWFTDLLIAMNMDDIQIFKQEISAALILVIITAIIVGILQRKRKIKTNIDTNVAESECGHKEEIHNLIIPAVASIVLLLIIAICIISPQENTSDNKEHPSVLDNTEIQNGSTADSNLLMDDICDICVQIENSFSSLGFEKGSLTTKSDIYDTSTMSAEIYNFRLGKKAYLYQDRDTGKYTTLFLPIHFSININQTLTFNKQTIDDIVGYAWIVLYEVDAQGELQYEVYSYLTSQYFISEELLYDHLCGNGYIIEEIVLSR